MIARRSGPEGPIAPPAIPSARMAGDPTGNDRNERFVPRGDLNGAPPRGRMT